MNKYTHVQHSSHPSPPISAPPSPPQRFDMEVFARAIQDYKCTRGHLVPPIVLGVIASEQLRWRRECSAGVTLTVPIDSR